MQGLVNNFTVAMCKYKRGDDYEHFKFTTSIYSKKLAERTYLSESLPNARSAAHARYPTRGVLCIGTDLVVTNKTHVRMNQEVYNWLAPTRSVFVKASEHAKPRSANLP